MNVYTVLDNKVYSMSIENINKLRADASIPMVHPNEYLAGSWDESYDYANSVVRSKLDVNTISGARNEDHVWEVIDCIINNNLTEAQEVNPAVKLSVSYTILDAFHNEVESKVCKTTIGELKEIMVPYAIDSANALSYGIAQNASGRVVIGAAFRELGISKSTRSESRIVRIDNVVVSISTTDRSIYSMYLSNAQTMIGWTPTSPTQEQISEYDIPIFNLADTHPTAGLPKLPHLITIPERNDKVYLDINLNTSLFAYTFSAKDIEDRLFINQRKQMKYNITTATDWNCAVDKPILEKLTFGDEVILKITANHGYKISKITFDGKYYGSGSVSIGNVDGYQSPYRITPANIVISWDDLCQNVEINIGSVMDSFRFGVSSEVSPIVPPEEPTDVPETPDDTENDSGAEGEGTPSNPDGVSGEVSKEETPEAGSDTVDETPTT